MMRWNLVTRTFYGHTGGCGNQEIRWGVDDPDFDRASFTRSLAETVAWSTSRVDTREPSLCLRSFETQPEDWHETATLSQRHINDAIARRSAALAQRGITPQPIMTVPHGRLLAFTADDCTFEGRMAGESNGFFGHMETPPWDTWVHYSPRKNVLISWVPEAFVGLVDESLWAMNHEWLWWVTEPTLLH